MHVHITQSFPLPGNDLKEMIADSYTEACTPVLMAALFVLTKTWKQPNTYQQVMPIQWKIAQ